MIGKVYLVEDPIISAMENVQTKRSAELDLGRRPEKPRSSRGVLSVATLAYKSTFASSTPDPKRCSVNVKS